MATDSSSQPWPGEMPADRWASWGAFGLGVVTLVTVTLVRLVP